MVETECEYHASFKCAERYVGENKAQLKDTDYVQLKACIAAVNEKIQFVGNHVFMSSTTFGFQGDSISECFNTKIKCWDMKVDGTFNLDRSSLMQMGHSTSIDHH